MGRAGNAAKSQTQLKYLDSHKENQWQDNAITEQTSVGNALQALTWDISLFPLCAVSQTLSFCQFKDILLIPADLAAILISPSFPLHTLAGQNERQH